MMINSGLQMGCKTSILPKHYFIIHDINLFTFSYSFSQGQHPPTTSERRRIGLTLILHHELITLTLHYTNKSHLDEKFNTSHGFVIRSSKLHWPRMNLFSQSGISSKLENALGRLC